jgi:hypothetical protein
MDMSELKTQVNDASVEEFLHAVPDEVKRSDSFALLKLFAEVTNKPAKMWGSSIVGFDSYHYKSERSKQEGDWPMVGFSPRKQNLTLYFILGFDDYLDLLAKLGKHKTSVGCLYIKKLADVDMAVLKELVQKSYRAMQTKYNP